MLYQGPLNKNDALSQAFILNIEVTPTSLTIALPLSEKIYKQLTLVVIYRPNSLVVAPNYYLVPTCYLVSTTYKDKVITNTL